MNKALLLLILATLASASAAAYFHSQLKAERQRNDELQARLEAQPQPHIPNPFTPAPPPPPPAEVVEPVQAAATRLAVRLDPVSPQPAAMSPERSAQMRQRFVNRQRELLRDPEYRQAMRTQQRFSLQQIHPDLARELNISQEQADRLLDLLADQHLRNMERAEDFSPDRPPTQAELAQMQKTAQQRQLADRAEIGALIGSNGQQQWQDYENSMGARMRVRQLSSALDNAGSPLRDDQRQPLRDALAQFERQAQEDRRMQMTTRNFASMTGDDRLAWQEEQLDRTERSYERARESVAHILTGDQLQTYRDLQEQELAMRRASLRMQRAQMEAGGEAAASNAFFAGQAVVAE